MRDLEPFSADWTFCGIAKGKQIDTPPVGRKVCLPHSAVELPLGYFDDRIYQRPFLYKKVLPWRAEFADKAVSLVFDGAMADTQVFLNGARIASHPDGYTPFEADLTGRLRQGDNLITVRLSGAENPAIPPFGGQIDYLTYAGLYRDVWLKVTPRISIANVKVETEDVLSPRKVVTLAIRLHNPDDLPLRGRAIAEIATEGGEVLARGETKLRATGCEFIFDDITGVALWSLDLPILYEARVTLEVNGETDRTVTRFGFRTAEFRTEGFFLNGKPLKLRGLNRHQSFPYVGYAMGRRAQERDAEILKHELKCNIVRTSHYPQSPWFLDHCDRIGLLVFEEIPGWQHIGGPEWKKAALANVRAMIERDWNRPSVVIWGVRINESGDDHAFYGEANRLARSLDKTRPTGGVRCIENSELLEDVYTMNDFWMGANEAIRGNRPAAPLRDPLEVTGLGRAVPYLVTEFNGHMFPTKRTDSEERQAEHVMRHLRVLDAAYGDPSICGAIGWCMADYNTHRDFGSGDRICHHGVMDMFRQPKPAAWVYRSQCDPEEEAVLMPVTCWARGERAIGGVLPLIVLTNCEEVSFQYGDYPAKRILPDRETFPNLPHAPVVIDDRFVSAAEVGAWGMSWEDGTLVGYVSGNPVARVTLRANAVPERLDIRADCDLLDYGAKDSTRIVVAARDGAGNPLPYLDEVVAFEVTGPARIVGPEILALKGGSAALWIETTGAPGEIVLTAFGQRLGSARVTLAAR